MPRRNGWCRSWGPGEDPKRTWRNYRWMWEICFLAEVLHFLHSQMFEPGFSSENLPAKLRQCRNLGLLHDLVTNYTEGLVRWLCRKSEKPHVELWCPISLFVNVSSLPFPSGAMIPVGSYVCWWANQLNFLVSSDHLLKQWIIQGLATGSYQKWFCLKDLTTKQ